MNFLFGGSILWLAASIGAAFFKAGDVTFCVGVSMAFLIAYAVVRELTKN